MRTWCGRNSNLTSNWRKKSSGNVGYLQKKLAMRQTCCGATLGLVLAVVGTRAPAHLHAFNLTLLESVRVDGSTLVVTELATVATDVLFGLAPALQLAASSATSLTH